MTEPKIKWLEGLLKNLDGFEASPKDTPVAILRNLHDLGVSIIADHLKALAPMVYRMNKNKILVPFAEPSKEVIQSTFEGMLTGTPQRWVWDRIEEAIRKTKLITEAFSDELYAEQISPALAANKGCLSIIDYGITNYKLTDCQTVLPLILLQRSFSGKSIVELGPELFPKTIDFSWFVSEDALALDENYTKARESKDVVEFLAKGHQEKLSALCASLLPKTLQKQFFKEFPGLSDLYTLYKKEIGKLSFEVKAIKVTEKAPEEIVLETAPKATSPESSTDAALTWLDTVYGIRLSETVQRQPGAATALSEIQTLLTQKAEKITALNGLPSIGILVNGTASERGRCNYSCVAHSRVEFTVPPTQVVQRLENVLATAGSGASLPRALEDAFCTAQYSPSELNDRFEDNQHDSTDHDYDEYDSSETDAFSASLRIGPRSISLRNVVPDALLSTLNAKYGSSGSLIAEIADICQQLHMKAHYLRNLR